MRHASVAGVHADGSLEDEGYDIDGAAQIFTQLRGATAADPHTHAPHPRKIEKDDHTMKHLLLLATGGTIACKPTEKGLAPALSAEEMLSFIDTPGTADIEAVDILNIDSSNMQPEEWLIIAHEIREYSASRKYDGIVLTHGTDTLAYTASALTFLLMDVDIPVVLTGSQYPIIQPDSDARDNLSDAIVAAEALPSGVYVCFNHSVMLGCRAVKTHTFSLRAFESINYPYIGTVLNGTFAGLNTAIPQPDKSLLPKSSGIDPRVALIKLIPGTSPAMIEAALTCSMAGVVIESFGMGGVHSIRRDHNRSLKRLMENGVAVVLASQCLNESSSMDVYEVSSALREAGAISAKDMTTESAVTKLMWALDITRDPAELRRLMHTNFRGEIEG